MDKIIHTNDGLYPYFRESRPVRRKNYVKYIVAMKIFLLLLALSFHLSAKVYSQQISLNAKEESLRSVLKSIKKQSGYGFLLGSTSMKEAKPVTISLHLNSVEDALKKIFENQNLSYSIEGNFITVRPKPVAEKNLGPAMVSSPEDKRILIKGKVTDQKKKPLEGVSIRVKESNKGTITDAYGNYSIAADPTDILVFTYVGFFTVEQKVGERTEINITLIESSTDLKEFGVVSTGYQTIPQERVTGSFASPDKKMFEDRISTDILPKLEGITSGLVFNSPAITGKNDAQISIRGRSTIFANDQPLIVVDNFPYDGNITDINPNDVESVTVLKDAAAASIWGVRAGNGVIVITTKHGRTNQPLKVSFNTNFTLSEKPNLKYDPNFLNSSDEIDVEQMLFGNGFYDGQISDLYHPALTPVVDLLNKAKNGTITDAQAKAQIDALRKNDVRDQLLSTFYRPNFNQQYALNVSSGNEKTSTYLSAGYDHNNTMLKGTSYQRFTVDFKNDYKILKNLTLSTGLNYVQTNNKSDNTLATFLPGVKYPYLQFRDASGNALPIAYGHSNDFVNSAISNGYLEWSYNPIKEINEGYNTSKTLSSSTRVTAGLLYQIIPELSVEVKGQYGRFTSDGSSYSPVESYYARDLINQYTDFSGGPVVYNIPIGGMLRASNSATVSRNLRGQLNFNQQWGKHYLTAIAGVEGREIKTDYKSYNYYGYDQSTASQIPVNYTTIFNTNPLGMGKIPNGNNTGGSLDRFRSYFGNAAYTFAGKYTLSTSGRIDGSNYFGVETNQKNVPLWSVGGKWDIDKEPFYISSLFPTMKIRATYGYNGNLDKTLAAVTTLKYPGLVSRATNVIYAMVSNYGNPDLRWEKAGIFNLGIDFSTKHQILSGSIEYYHKKGVDLIGDLQTAPSTGVIQFRGNYSNMKGNGIDVKLTTQNIEREVSWRTTILFSWATDQVTKYDGERFPSDGLLAGNQNTYPIVGRPVYTIYSQKWAGLDPKTGDPQGYNAKGEVSKDYATLNAPESFDQLIYNGPARPVYFGGLNNRIAYKNFALNFNISYKLGYYFRKSSISYQRLFNNQQGHQDFEKRWKQMGDEKFTNVPSMVYPNDQARDVFYSNSSIMVDKGDHIRFQDVSLSYDLRKSELKSLPFDNLQLYFYVNNLGILWRANKDHIDPDYSTGGILSVRTYSLGVKASF